MGYEAAREQILARQKELGIVPPDTELPPINPIGTPETRTGPGRPAVPAAGLHQAVGHPVAPTSGGCSPAWPRSTPGSSPTPTHQIGRLLDHLESIDQLENTLIFVVSDNGASGEGGPNGSVNENKFFNGIPDDLAAEPGDARRARRPGDVQPLPDRLGDGVQHPVQDVEALLVQRRHLRPVHRLLAGRHRRPAARSGTSTTTPSTSCRPCWTASASSSPRAVRGVTQIPIQGVSMVSSFDAAPTRRRRGRRSSSRCSAPAGSGTTGWKAVTTHPALGGWGHYDDDTWELYHVDTDRSELHDLAAEEPERLAELVGLWFYEAGANHAFPLDDRSALEIILTPRPQLIPPRDRYVYRPGAAEIPEHIAVNVRNRSFTIGAQVDLPTPGRAGRAVRPRQPLRRARPLRQGQPAALREQLRRHHRAAGRRHRGPADRRDLILSAASTRPARTRPAPRRRRCRSTTATARSARARSAPSRACSPSPARA